MATRDMKRRVLGRLGQPQLKLIAHVDQLNSSLSVVLLCELLRLASWFTFTSKLNRARKVLRVMLYFRIVCPQTMTTSPVKNGPRWRFAEMMLLTSVWSSNRLVFLVLFFFSSSSVLLRSGTWLSCLFFLSLSQTTFFEETQSRADSLNRTVVSFRCSRFDETEAVKRSHTFLRKLDKPLISALMFSKRVQRARLRSVRCGARSSAVTHTRRTHTHLRVRKHAFRCVPVTECSFDTPVKDKIQFLGQTDEFISASLLWFVRWCSRKRFLLLEWRLWVIKNQQRAECMRRESHRRHVLKENE